jgi:hypothetical protein
VPSQYSWFTPAGDHFALRDSNLNPDYPTSAQYAEQLFTQEGGPAVQGIISITPALIEQVLGIIGPVAVSQFHQVVTSSNVRDLIHYYHIADGLGLVDGASGASYQTSDRKVFDAAFGDALLQAIAHVSSVQQRALGEVALTGLHTHDLQAYFNDASMEHLLASAHVDGALPSPAADAFMVVDTNVGANYANADVTEQMSDAVKLDAQGNATHTLTLSLTYPEARHLYDALYVEAGQHWTYSDFVRVIVPSSAHLLGTSGCGWTATYQPGHTAWGCRVWLARPDTIALTLHWTVPHAVTTLRGAAHYVLQVQRQAGARDTLALSIAVPISDHLVQPAQAPLNPAHGNQLIYAGALTMDDEFSAVFRANKS